MEVIEQKNNSHSIKRFGISISQYRLKKRTTTVRTTITRIQPETDKRFAIWLIDDNIVVSRVAQIMDYDTLTLISAGKLTTLTEIKPKQHHMYDTSTDFSGGKYMTGLNAKLENPNHKIMTQRARYEHLIEKANQRILNTEASDYYEIFRKKKKQNRTVCRYQELIVKQQIRKENKSYTVNQLLDITSDFEYKSEKVEYWINYLRTMKFGHAKGCLLVPILQNQILLEIGMCRITGNQ